MLFAIEFVSRLSRLDKGIRSEKKYHTERSQTWHPVPAEDVIIKATSV